MSSQLTVIEEVEHDRFQLDAHQWFWSMSRQRFWTPAGEEKEDGQGRCLEQSLKENRLILDGFIEARKQQSLSMAIGHALTLRGSDNWIGSP